MLLDIGAGILAALFVGRWFYLPITASWVGAGIIFALLPDADYLLHLARGGTVHNASRHRDLLHYPLVFALIAVALGHLFGGPWKYLFFFATWFHFLHDSIGIGWGVQWLYPITNDHYSFLYLYHPKGKPRFPKKWIYVFDHEEIDRLHETHGDPDWFEHIYLKLHPYAIIEFVGFIGAIIAFFLLT